MAAENPTTEPDRGYADPTAVRGGDQGLGRARGTRRLTAPRPFRHPGMGALGGGWSCGPRWPVAARRPLIGRTRWFKSERGRATGRLPAAARAGPSVARGRGDRSRERFPS